jgi:hypothetical protein
MGVLHAVTATIHLQVWILVAVSEVEVADITTAAANTTKAVIMVYLEFQTLAL